ncbi:MAG: fumarylacetoacetate hydrolase family protein [Acidimicrobiia bacterium]
MKLARFVSSRSGEACTGVVEGDRVTPVGPADQHALLAMATSRRVPAAAGTSEALAEVTLLCPVPDPPSVRDFYAFEAHVAAGRRTRGLEVDPDWYELPVFYFSNPAAVVGPGDPVHAPEGSTELDYELEVAAVVGATTSVVDPDRWTEVVAGFTVMNDWSARDLQRREVRLGLGPAKGKDFATSLGPVLVTPDELLDGDGRVHAAMRARVDGSLWSEGELADMHHGWPTLLAHAARGTTLRPGDVVGSGTVGTGCILELAARHGADHRPWLVPGQVVELEVEGIGRLANPIVGR